MTAAMQGLCQGYDEQFEYLFFLQPVELTSHNSSHTRPYCDPGEFGISAGGTSSCLKEEQTRKLHAFLISYTHSGFVRSDRNNVKII